MRPAGACLFLRRAALADVGPFDERFFVYYEETDWLIRAKRRGWRTVFLPTVEAVHASAGSSPDARSPHVLLLLESQHRYARKHFGPATAALLRTTLLGIDTARLARHALAGRARARGPRRRPHPRPPHDARAPALVARWRSRTHRSLDAVERRGLEAPCGASRARLRDTRVAAHLVASLREGAAPADRARPRPAASWSRSCRCTSGGGTAFRCCGSSATARATNSDPISAPLSEPAAAAGGQRGHGRRSVAALRAARRAGRRRSALRELTGARPLYREASPVLRFEHDSWDEFLRERGRNFRQQVRRFPRKLSELGTVSYRLATDPERLPRDLDTLFHLHRQRWGNAATPFLLAAPFHREFATQALHRGWLRLWFLEIDGKPVAALLRLPVRRRRVGLPVRKRPGVARSSRSVSCFSRMPCAKR